MTMGENKRTIGIGEKGIKPLSFKIEEENEMNELEETKAVAALNIVIGKLKEDNEILTRRMGYKDDTIEKAKENLAFKDSKLRELSKHIEELSSRCGSSDREIAELKLRNERQEHTLITVEGSSEVEIKEDPLIEQMKSEITFLRNAVHCYLPKKGIFN